MANTGWLNPGSVTQATGAVEPRNSYPVWSNLSNGLTENASGVLAGHLDGPDPVPGYTDWLLFSGYDTSGIPEEHEIQGIEVRVVRVGDGICYDERVQIDPAGGTPSSGDNKAITDTLWPGTYTAQVYGAEDDLWGHEWTDADSLKVGLICEFGLLEPAYFDNCLVDVVQVKVYHGEPVVAGGGSSQEGTSRVTSQEGGKITTQEYGRAG